MQTTKTLMQIEHDAHELRAAYLGRMLRDATAALKRAFTAPASNDRPLNA